MNTGGRQICSRFRPLHRAFLLLLVPLRLACGEGAVPWHSAVEYGQFVWPQPDVDAAPVVRLEPATPHDYELRPYSRGTTRALVFVLAMETKPREIAELVQRFDLDVDLVYVTQGYKWSGQGDYYANFVYFMQVYQRYQDFAKSDGVGPGEKRLNRLLEEDHDVYIFADVLAGNWPPGTRHKFDFLPPPQMQKIVDKVKAGAGIVCTGEMPRDFFLAAATPLASTPSRLTTGSVIAHLADYSGVTARLKQQGSAVTDRSAAEALVTAFEVGAGRGIHVSYPNVGHINALVPVIPYSDTAQVDYDHWLAWLGRAILWAAGKESAIELVFPDGDELVFRQSTLDTATIAVTVSVAAEGQALLRLQPRIVNRTGDAWNLPAVPVEPDGTTFAIPLPQLPAGDYFLDVVCGSDAGVLGIWSKAFAVRSDIGIEALVLARLHAAAGAELGGRLRLRNAFAAPGRTLSVSLRDSWGRDISRREVRLPEARLAALYYGSEWQRQLYSVYADGKADQHEELPFTITVPTTATLGMTAIAVLAQDGRVIDSKRAHFTVPRIDRAKFRFLQWHPPFDYLGYHAFRRLGEDGWNGVMTQEGRSSNVAVACNMPATRYVMRVTDRVTPAGIIDGQYLTNVKGPLPWNDVAAMTERFDALARAYSHTDRQGVIAYSIGDEGTLRGADLSPQDLEAYREYLRQRYGAITALNESWDSDYRAFAEIELLEFAAVAERFQGIENFNLTHATAFATWDEAKAAYGAAYGASSRIKADIYGDWAYLIGNYPRWYDRQAFARTNYGVLMGRFASAIRRYVPGATVGVEGVRSIWGHRINLATYAGIWRNPTAVADLDDLAARSGFLGIDGNNPVADVLHALASPDDLHIASRWMHGNDTFDSMMAQTWDAVTSGSKGIGFCIWSALDESASDYKGFLEFSSLAPMAQNAAPWTAETAVIRMGLGDLVANLSHAHDEVGILYSMPSNFMGWADGNPAYGHFDLAHCAWAYGSRELGIGYRYLTERMVQQGALADSACKVLILPYALALEQTTAAEIRQFVNQGGTVVADVRPAVYSGRCRKLARGALDDLFGVEVKARGDAKDVRLSADVSWQGATCRMTDLSTALEADLVLDGARAGHSLGANPLMIAHAYGSGQTLLLNFHLDSFMKERGTAGSDNVRRLLAAIYSGAGVASHVSQVLLDGVPARELEVRTWRSGGIRIMSVQKRLPYEWLQKPQEELAKLFRTHDLTVRFPRTFTVCDINEGTSLGRTAEIQARIRSGYARFYALLPAEEPAASCVLSSSVVHRPEAFTLTIGPETTGSIPPGLRAYYLQLFDPGGTEARWARQVILADETGKGVPLNAACNDAPGRWTIVATALLGGKSAQTHYEVLP